MNGNAWHRRPFDISEEPIFFFFLGGSGVDLAKKLVSIGYGGIRRTVR
jgi:hypothetical protein